MTPSTSPPRVATAVASASTTRLLRMCSVSDQPITRRENKSITVARYSQPSPVAR